jgi:2-polyprenyl-3-methyl-5-hydroxy-6-metoxy-1,4-benzoquinol methylase
MQSWCVTVRNEKFSREILLSALPLTLAGMDVLDIGCGEEIITRAVAARGAAALSVDPDLC